MGEMAKMIIIAGIMLVLIGLLMLVIPKLPFLGKLPGDLVVKRGHFTFFFPLATSIIVSIIISLILYLLGRFR